MKKAGLGGAYGQPVQALRDQLLAAARLTLDQHRERRIGELGDLALQLHQRRALADQSLGVAAAPLLGQELRFAERERAGQQPAQRFRVAGLGDELSGPRGACMPCVPGVVLPREHNNPHPWRVRQQIGDELEALLRRMRRRGQSQVHQRQLWRLGELTQAFDGVRPRLAGKHLEIGG